MYSDRPRLQLPRHRLDRFLELFSISLLLFLWLYTILSFGKLPEKIPLHYGLNGEADRFGDKVFIWSLPIIGTIIFAGMYLLTKIPHRFNYLTAITSENAARQYQLASQLLRIVNLVVVMAITFITWKMIDGALKGNSSLGLWFIPALFLGLFAPVIYYAYQSTRSNRSSTITGQ